CHPGTTVSTMQPPAWMGGAGGGGRRAEGRRSGGGEACEHAGLGEQGESVGYAPVFGDAAVDDAADVDDGDVDRPAGGWAEERAGGDAAHANAGPEGVAGFGEVFDLVGQVGDGGVHVGDGLFEVGDGGCSGAGDAELVLDEVR